MPPTPPTPIDDILIAGDGIVAQATVLAAANAGLAPHHLTWTPPTPPTDLPDRHYALSHRSVRFLHRLGIAPALLPVREFHLYAGATRHRLHTPPPQAPLCSMTTEHALRTALGAATALLPRTAYTHLHIDDNTPANTPLSYTINPNSPHPLRGRTRLLAAADGANSPLARQLNIHPTVHDFHQNGITALIDLPATAPSPPCAHQWFADNDIIALLPTPPTPQKTAPYALVWSTTTPPDTPPPTLQNILRHRTGLPNLHLRADSLRHFPLRAITRPTRVAPRAALIGDAAGTLHPLAGQGLNIGLGDAETLIATAAPRLRGDIALGLAAYHLTRTPRAAALQHLTRLLLPRAPRAATLLTATRLPLLRQTAIALANA